MKSTATLLDSELDAARMELQATAELVNRSLGEAYRLIGAAQRRFRQLTTNKTAQAGTRAA